VQLQAAGKQLRFEQHAVQSLALTVNYAADDKKPSQVQLSATGLSSGATQIAKLLISGQGLKQQHNFTVQANSEQGDVNLALSGNLQGNQWQARLSELEVKQAQAGRWLLKQPALLNIHKRDAGVDVTLTETCFSQITAIVCLQGSYPANGYFQGVFHALLPSELAKAYLPKDLKLAGQLNVDGHVAKNRAGLSGNYRLSLSKNSTVTVKIDKQLTTIPVNQLLLAGTLQGSQVNGNLNLLFGGKNYVRGQLNLDTATTQAMSGQFSAAIMDFTPLQPYILPLSELKGNLSAAVTIAGTLSKPALLGNVSLNNAAVSAEQAGIRIEEIAVKLYTLATAPERVLITGTAKSGSGRVSLNGNVQLKPALGYPADLLISGTEFEVVKLPQALITISPELSCKYAHNVGAITGKLTVAKAQIKLAELPTHAAVPSEDEQIIGEEKTTQETSVLAPKIGVNIAVDLGKQSHFSGLGLDTDLLGSLRLTQKADNLVLFGTVDMQKGRYKSYGQDLTIRRGRFVFNGSPSNPGLDVEAIRLSKSQKVTAILKLSGALQNPQTQISSEPSLPESDALAYLVTGRALNQVTKSDGNMLASAALSYGAGKVAWIAEKFGIDEFELQEGESIKDSLVAMGQYLTPDFYVGAKVGLFSKQNALILKYKITEHLSISTQSGESQRVYLNYEFSHE
jgi:translocation and assembly module TamB